VSASGSVEKLPREHLLGDFDCGKEEPNRSLKREAWASQQSHSAQTYVLAKDLRVLGYYSLAAGSVTHVSVHGKGLGAALLKDALLRTALAADTVGARALLVHAKNQSAKAFYEGFDFEPSPSDPYHLLLIMKDLFRIAAR